MDEDILGITCPLECELVPEALSFAVSTKAALQKVARWGGLTIRCYGIWSVHDRSTP